MRVYVALTSVCARYSSSGASQPWLANARKFRDGRWTMSGGLLAANRTVILSTNSRNGTCVFLILTPGYLASNALISSVQYSLAPGSSACHVGKSSSIAFVCAQTEAATTRANRPAIHRFHFIVPPTLFQPSLKRAGSIASIRPLVSHHGPA